MSKELCERIARALNWEAPSFFPVQNGYICISQRRALTVTSDSYELKRKIIINPWKTSFVTKKFTFTNEPSLLKAITDGIQWLKKCY